MPATSRASESLVYNIRVRLLQRMLLSKRYALPRARSAAAASARRMLKHPARAGVSTKAMQLTGRIDLGTIAADRIHRASGDRLRTRWRHITHAVIGNASRFFGKRSAYYPGNHLGVVVLSRKRWGDEAGGRHCSRFRISDTDLCTPCDWPTYHNHKCYHRNIGGFGTGCAPRMVNSSPRTPIKDEYLQPAERRACGAAHSCGPATTASARRTCHSTWLGYLLS